MSTIISTWRALYVENRKLEQNARNFQLSTFFQSIMFPLSGQLIKMLDIIPGNTACAKQIVIPHTLKSFCITIEKKYHLENKILSLIYKKCATQFTYYLVQVSNMTSRLLSKVNLIFLFLCQCLNITVSVSTGNNCIKT